MENSTSKLLKRRQYNRLWMNKKRKLAQASVTTCRVQIPSSFDDDGDTILEEPSIHSGILDANEWATSQPFAHAIDQTANDRPITPSNSPSKSPQLEVAVICNTNIDHSDSESDFLSTESSFSAKLSNWVNECGIKGVAVDRLLKLLRANGHLELPASWRTLLKSPRIVAVKTVSGMQYHHFGLQQMIANSLKSIPINKILAVDCFEIALNIDGLPIFKSSNASAWPILCRVTNIQGANVFPVSIGVGKSKPIDLQFLEDCVYDINMALSNGIEFANKHFDVKLKCIICDAPARAMVKGVKLYSGYYGCDKCNQHGAYCGRVIYPEIASLHIRTDIEFRANEQKAHHTGPTPFTMIPSLNMVDDFPIDYMHQTCLGVMRRLLLIWMRGPTGRNRLSAYQISTISCKLVKLRQHIPRDFGRKPRPLDEIDRWKATEFRQLLLYTGLLVLKGVLSNKQFAHFKALMVALCILVCPRLAAEHSSYAKKLLRYFVARGSRKLMYGKHFLVYNVHSLLHLEREVLRFGSLDNCAAWSFENYMQQLKRNVRSTKNPVVQIVKRVREQFATQKQCQNEQETVRTIFCRRPDNAYKTSTGRYCEVLKIASRLHQTYLCRFYYSAQPVFNKPCDSGLLGICKFKKNDSRLEVIKADLLCTRCMMIPQGSRHVFLPLLHSL